MNNETSAGFIQMPVRSDSIFQTDHLFRHDSLANGSYICAMKLLMVCLGNICRSPLAEGIMKRNWLDAGLDWYVDSAGTNGSISAPHFLRKKLPCPWN